MAGIIFFQPKIYRFWHPPNRVLDYCWKLTAVALAAQLTTFPISIYYFHQFPLYFWLSGLVVVTAASFILGLGILLFLVQAVPFLSVWAGKALYGVLWGTNAFHLCGAEITRRPAFRYLDRTKHHAAAVFGSAEPGGMDTYPPRPGYDHLPGNAATRGYFFI